MPQESDVTAAIIAKHRETSGVAPRADITSDEIVERTMFPLVNEGFRILEEECALRPLDIDVVYCHGYGWPRHRGGPMHWADREVGLAHILAALRGARPVPEPALLHGSVVALARRGAFWALPRGLLGDGGRRPAVSGGAR